LQKSKLYSKKYLKPLFSISKIPSPTATSFKLKKPSLKRDSFASSSKNTVDAINSCSMSLDQNAVVVKGLSCNLLWGIQFHLRNVAVLTNRQTFSSLRHFLSPCSRFPTFILHHPLQPFIANPTPLSFHLLVLDVSRFKVH
jgi:hypothetical protein